MLNKKGLLSILFWSVISAAFIGPGTVTTAAAAGALYHTDLLWTLTFSTIACIFLQEASARITIGSGKNMGEAIAEKYGEKSKWIKLLLSISIIFGCVAYQTGNILGAISGLGLIYDIHPSIFTALIVMVGALLLWFGNYKNVAHFMGIIVGIIGVGFCTVALQLDWSALTVIKSAFTPSLPTGSGIYVISLIGTTIVPYNLFLASGISQGQTIKEMRFGISIAILIGGIISMAVVLVGTSINGDFTFQALAQSMSATLGAGAEYLVGIGLFAAGFTSSITAPLAAAITAQSIWGKSDDKWGPTSFNYRSIWILVLVTGLIFGMLNLKPIPVIILAQAINGFLLPLIAYFLIILVNDPKLLGHHLLNSALTNLIMYLVVGVSTFIGLINLFKVFYLLFDKEFDANNIEISIISIFTLALIGFTIKKVRALKFVNPD